MVGEGDETRWNEVGWARNSGIRVSPTKWPSSVEKRTGTVIVFVGLRAVAVTPETSFREVKAHADDTKEGKKEVVGGGRRDKRVKDHRTRDENREGAKDWDAKTETRVRRDSRIYPRNKIRYSLVNTLFFTYTAYSFSHGRRSLSLLRGVAIRCAYVHTYMAHELE